jgi:hypothetical protein
MAEQRSNVHSRFTKIGYVFDLADEEENYLAHHQDDTEHRKSFWHFVIGFKLYTLGDDFKNVRIVG